MKKIIVSFVIMTSLLFMSCKGDAKAETKTVTKSIKGTELSEGNFGVRGNCGMCKENIEKAAKSVKGVAAATWDVKKKQILVSYDEHMVNEKKIQIAIAAAGYDTDKFKGDEKAYSKLAKCCQYSHEQKMNQ